jgi:hypothetical protein
MLGFQPENRFFSFYNPTRRCACVGLGYIRLSAEKYFSTQNLKLAT